jgi:hypothetical protein
LLGDCCIVWGQSRHLTSKFFYSCRCKVLHVLHKKVVFSILIGNLYLNSVIVKLIEWFTWNQWFLFIINFLSFLYLYVFKGTLIYIWTQGFPLWIWGFKWCIQEANSCRVIVNGKNRVMLFMFWCSKVLCHFSVLERVILSLLDLNLSPWEIVKSTL